MKMIMLAGVALAFAAPVMAQETPMAPAAPQAAAPMPPAPPPPPADVPPPPPPTPEAAPPAPAMAQADANAPDPVGGYQPTTPPLSGTPVAGQAVIVQPSVSPNQAFPPPAPLASYPICKKGQYDNCRQRGG